MGTLFVGVCLVSVGIGLGWWLKSRFGVKVAADVAVVKDTAAKL